MKSAGLKRTRIVRLVALSLLLICGAPLAGQAFAQDGATPAVAPAVGTVLDRWTVAVQARLASLDQTAGPVAPAIGAGPPLKVGATGERVDRLAAALVARTIPVPGSGQGQFDAALEQAVRTFQAAEGLPVDGVAGATTVGALDRTPAATAAALKETLTEMHTLATHAPHEFFLVNIPSQTAYLIQGDTIALSMRVAVGRPSRPTPLLKDQITDVILNPTWTAPTTVLAQDKLPSLRRTGHPGIEGATIYLDGQEVDPATVDWTLIEPERLRIVQSPGNQNALGRFKFNLTNDDSIYLHDTNDHSVFARQNRAISSGCVRLAEPRRLAETLLGREGWTPEQITHAVDAAHTKAIGLKRPLPVRIVYWQATVDESGVVRVQRDVYGSATPSADASHATDVPAPRPAPTAAAAPAATMTPPQRAVQVGEAPPIPRRPPPPRPTENTALCDANCGWSLY